MEANSAYSPTGYVDQLVAPGDVVLDLSTMTNQTIKLGGGLRQDCDAITVIKAAKLRFSKPNKYWVESSQKRNYLVDIKGPALAFLPVLAFEGGTRRNIPKFEVGTLLYVRVVKANAGMNPELACMDVCGKAAEFGPLKDGYMFESSTGLSRMLLSSPACSVLEALGKKLSFEIAVGLNGLSLGERCISVNSYPRRKCNHEFRVSEWGTTKNYGRQTAPENAVAKLVQVIMNGKILILVLSPYHPDPSFSLFYIIVYLFICIISLYHTLLFNY